MVPHLLIVDEGQFGYLTDAYAYCRHLQADFAITYVCWDYHYARIPMAGVDVVYVSRKGAKIRRVWRYLAAVVRLMNTGKYDVALVIYFRFCSVLRVLRHSMPMILDIRTGSVVRPPAGRRMWNLLLKLESSAFPCITIVSEGLMHALGLKSAKCNILPVGAEDLGLAPKSFHAMHLFYVGTLARRCLHITIEGFDRFCDEVKGAIEVSYDIVGDGPKPDTDKLVHAIARARHRDSIRLLGRVPISDIKPYFEQHNIGIAFVPLEPCYQHQPVTKVFEYLLAGMPVLATNTLENIKVITPENGVLCSDTAEGFCLGLQALFNNRWRYDSGKIKSASTRFLWPRIINGILKQELLRHISTAHEPRQGS